MSLVIFATNRHIDGFAPVEALSHIIDNVTMSLKSDPRVNGFVILSTCNRVELIIDIKDVDTSEEFNFFSQELISLMVANAHINLQTIDILSGPKAIHHLFEVASGLDSVIIGEREIAGQMRRALTAAREKGTITKLLSKVIEAALKTSRRVEQTTKLCGHGRSLVSTGIDLAISDASKHQHVLLVGTGSYAGATVHALTTRNITNVDVFSPSGRAHDFAQRHSIGIVGDLLHCLIRANLVITCSGRGTVVITQDIIKKTMEYRDDELVILNLAVPSDIDESVAGLPNVRVISIADIDAHAPQADADDIQKARHLVDQGAAEIADAFLVEAMNPAITRMRTWFDKQLDEELTLLPQQGTLAVEDVERRLRRITARMAHTPSARAKQAAIQGRQREFLTAIEDVFGVDGNEETKNDNCEVTESMGDAPTRPAHQGLVIGREALTHQHAATGQRVGEQCMDRNINNYDAALIISYGGPRGPEDVLPFMRNATRGRGVPDERLLAVSKHYDRYHGVSPINACNDQLIRDIQTELGNRHIQIPAYLGNRNWHPFLTDTLRDMIRQGHRRIIATTTAAYASYSGCRQYREDLGQALSTLSEEGIPVDDIVIHKTRPYYFESGFITANADALVDAINTIGGNETDTRVVFVTHSIPIGMNDASGPGSPHMHYLQQHRYAAHRIIADAAAKTQRTLNWDLAFCSRSGAPHHPWLEPDINDHLEQLAKTSMSKVVVAPIGFISDHMEVVHDLDFEAANTAKECGLSFVRARTAGQSHPFIKSLVDLLEQRAQNSHHGDREEQLWQGACEGKCCLAFPGYLPQPQTLAC